MDRNEGMFWSVEQCRWVPGPTRAGEAHQRQPGVAAGIPAPRPEPAGGRSTAEPVAPGR